MAFVTDAGIDRARVGVTSCPLTRAQYEVLLLVMRGKTYQDIALQRGVSESTVRYILQGARLRLGVSNTTQAAAMMLREEWVTPDEVLPSDRAMTDYAGPAYVTTRRHYIRDWLPSPAQRLYLDAFDRLLHERSETAAARVDFYFRAMCLERSRPDRRDGRADIDDMLLRLALALTRPISIAA